jgi:D-galactose 1-dehydrogenase
MAPVRIAVIGLGKIARDQHVPAIAASEEFELAATVDPGTDGLPGVPHFPDLSVLLNDGPKVDAVALCMPPHYRYDIAVSALMHNLHVLLEKPPCTTFSEAERLRVLANTLGLTLFAAWHSRFASGVEPARRWLAQRQITRVAATWHEDVRVWHPGQSWIMEEDGFGVLDPGINALSILTRILPLPLNLTYAKLFIPENWESPIAADLIFRDAANIEVILDLDWTKSGSPRWDIDVETNMGILKLERGGARLLLPLRESQGGQEECIELSGEYPKLYSHFARLIEVGDGDDDMKPLLHVTEVLEFGVHQTVEMFEI